MDRGAIPLCHCDLNSCLVSSLLSLATRPVPCLYLASSLCLQRDLLQPLQPFLCPFSLCEASSKKREVALIGDCGVMVIVNKGRGFGGIGPIGPNIFYLFFSFFLFWFAGSQTLIESILTSLFFFLNLKHNNVI